MTKQELREQAIFHRDRIRPEDEDIEQAGAHLRGHVPLKPGQTVAAYWPIGREFDVRYLIHDLLKDGLTIALPVLAPDTKVMTFSRWDGKGDLIKGTLGAFIPAQLDPVEPDVLLVPLLAFDMRGNRLGRGGGYYDATIADLRSRRDILTIGIGYAAQAVLFNLPTEAHDQKMDLVLTPNGIHDFRT